MLTKTDGWAGRRADRHTESPTVNYLPSDHSTLQVINLDKFTKTAGVVVVGCLGVAKGLIETTGDDTNTV